MISRTKLFLPAAVMAGLGLLGLTACGSSIDHQQATPLTYETQLASNVPHREPINIELTGGVYGEYTNISCPSDAEDKGFNTKSLDAEFEAADGGIYIAFEGTIPLAFVVQPDGNGRGEVIYYPRSAVSFISAADLERITTPENFPKRIARYCLA